MGKGKEAGAGRACAGGSPVVQEEKKREPPVGKGKEAGAGRACAGGPVSMRENKSVSRRRAAHAFDTGVACGGAGRAFGDALGAMGLGMRQRRAGFCGKG